MVTSEPPSSSRWRRSARSGAPLAGGGELVPFPDPPQLAVFLVPRPPGCRARAGSVLGRRGRQQLVETSERRGLVVILVCSARPFSSAGRRGEDLDLGVRAFEVTAGPPGCAHQRDRAVAANRDCSTTVRGSVAERGRAGNTVRCEHDGADRVAPPAARTKWVMSTSVSSGLQSAHTAAWVWNDSATVPGWKVGFSASSISFEVGEGEVIAVDAVHRGPLRAFWNTGRVASWLVVRPGHQLVCGGEAATMWRMTPAGPLTGPAAKSPV